MDKAPEQVLGRRIVNYLKNEALIGRIPRQKLQVGENYNMIQQHYVILPQMHCVQND